MPVKFKESTAKVEKGSKKKVVQNYYMQSTPTEILKEALLNPRTPKQKQKINNELAKRVKLGQL